MKKYYNKTYVVQDILKTNEIADILNVSEQELIAINYIVNNDLEKGDVLLVPEQIKFRHIVMPKENISVIAEKYGVTVSYIIKKNKLSSENIFIGQKLII